MGVQPESSTQEVPAGLVERVTYHNAENAPPNDPPACPAWGWGRKALKALPSSATRGRARDRSSSKSVASRFNVRSARNSFRRPQIHPRAVGKLYICYDLPRCEVVAAAIGGSPLSLRRMAAVS